MQGGMQRMASERSKADFDWGGSSRSTDEFPNYMKQKFLWPKRNRSLGIVMRPS